MSFGDTKFRPPVPLSRTTEFRAPVLVIPREKLGAGSAGTIERTADTRPIVVTSTLPSKYTVGGVNKLAFQAKGAGTEKATSLASLYTYGGASKTTVSIINPNGAFSQSVSTPFGQLEATMRLSRGY